MIHRVAEHLVDRATPDPRSGGIKKTAAEAMGISVNTVSFHLKNIT